MRRLLLIRHGESEWNRQKRWQGHSDVPLSEKGRAQAEALAGRLLGWTIDRLYCSDSRRAEETAGYVGEALGQTPEQDPEWRERDVGDLAGMTHAEATESHPEVFTSSQTTGRFDPPGGEGHYALRDRAIRVFECMRERHAGDETVAVVTHGGMIRAVLEHALGMPGDGSRARLGLSENTGLSMLQFDGRGIALLLLGDARHLPYAGKSESK